MMNEEMEQFEQRLKQQSPRPIPAEWRTEILAAARAAQPVHHSSPVDRHSFLSIINHQLSTLLWPHPKAWAGLAAAWVVIVGLQLTTREDSFPGLTVRGGSPSEMVTGIKKQRRMLAELINPRDEIVADRSKFEPKPHTQRVELRVA